MKTEKELKNHSIEFGEFIQDRLMGEDWFLLDKKVEELYEEFIKSKQKL